MCTERVRKAIQQVAMGSSSRGWNSGAGTRGDPLSALCTSG